MILCKICKICKICNNKNKNIIKKNKNNWLIH